MFTKIHNVVVAVYNVEEAAKVYTDNFDLKVARSGAVPELGIKSAHLTVGDATIELIEPLDPQQGPVARFLQNRGEGLYMIELAVADIDKAVKSLSEKGVRLIGADPESRAKGGLVFIHPQSAKGVLVQLVKQE